MAKNTTANKSRKSSTKPETSPETEIQTEIQTDAVNPQSLADLADEGADTDGDDTETGEMKPLADGEGGTKQAKRGRKPLVETIPAQIASLETQITNLQTPGWINAEIERLNRELTEKREMLSRIEAGETAKPSVLKRVDRIAETSRENAELALVHLAAKLGLDVDAVRAMMAANQPANPAS